MTALLLLADALARRWPALARRSLHACGPLWALHLAPPATMAL
jgi:hypothetical protein